MDATEKTDLAQNFMRMAHPGEWVSFEDFMRFCSTEVYMSREGNDKFDPSKKKHNHSEIGILGFWNELARGHYAHVAHMLEDLDRASHRTGRDEAQDLLFSNDAKEEDDKKKDVSASINPKAFEDEQYSLVQKVAFSAGKCVGHALKMCKLG